MTDNTIFSVNVAVMYGNLFDVYAECWKFVQSNANAHVVFYENLKTVKPLWSIILSDQICRPLRWHDAELSSQTQSYMNMLVHGT